MDRSIKSFCRMLCAFLLCVCSIVTSCYDDSALQEQLKDHESRLEELERLVTQQNTNISSLQTIVRALQEKDYVTNVAPITEGDKVAGYTITFSKSGSVTIYNGEDGCAPVIGIRQDADNLWYWTIEGEWLVDSNGDKVRASAIDGKDGEQGPSGQSGATPMLKIVDGYWYVSYDGGKTWEDEPLGQATGDRGYTMFADVSYDEDYLYITMADGTVISLPVVGHTLRIVPESQEFLVNSQKQTFEVEVKGATGGLEIDYILEDKSWSVTCTMVSDGKYQFNVSAPSVVSNTNLMIFANSDNGFAMRKVALTRERELMLSLNYADYDSYSLHVTVPETVLQSNNHVRFNILSLVDYNYIKHNRGLDSDDFIKAMLEWQNEYRAEYVTEDNDINLSNENAGYYPECYPGGPMVAFACEFTADGQPVGNSVMLEFKLKEPTRLNASLEVEVSDITSYDTEITIAPTKIAIRQCKMYILTDSEYEMYLDLLNGDEELLPWSVYSQTIQSHAEALYFEKDYIVVYDLDVTRISMSSLANDPSYIKPDTKYHILATGMSLDDCVVKSVTFTHQTFTTSKSQRNQAPEIIVSPLLGETSPNMAVFNIRCTSCDDVSSGPVFRAKYGFGPYREAKMAENSGYPIEELASTTFDSEQLAAINSASGLTLQIPCVDGERYVFAVSAQNDECFSNELSLEGCSSLAELTTPFLKKPYVSSELLTEDVLEGEWLMSAKDLSGKNIEATVRILRGYQEGRDYPSGCPDEFLEQVEIFNQKRLTDKNSLLLQGWFSADPRGRDLVRTPYDLLMATDYVAYDYQQLFMDAGPKMLLEVDASDNLKITVDTNCTISASAWTGSYYHYGGLSQEGMSEQMAFPVELSEDKRTMTINPVDGYYLNLVAFDWLVPSAYVRVNSQITITKK